MDVPARNTDNKKISPTTKNLCTIARTKKIQQYNTMHMKTPYIQTNNENIIPNVSKIPYLPSIQSKDKNKKYKINNLEMNSQYKPVKKLLLKIPITWYSSDTSSSQWSNESVQGNLLNTLDYTIAMTKDFLNFSSDSSKYTDKGNKRTKYILVGQSTVQSIVSANSSLIDKWKSNPNHHSISTKDPFNIIIKNIRSNAENTNHKTKLLDQDVVR